MAFEVKSENRAFGGVQRVIAHDSAELHCRMRMSVFTPPGRGPFPVFLWLSGLTCTEENFTVKAGAQRVASELGLLLVAPDTSPRGPDLDGAMVPGDPDGAWDFGHGAGYYVDATEAPWARHYRMQSYVSKEIPAFLAAHLPADIARIGVSGHSMGGHGALVMALKFPSLFRSASAFAPIVAPSEVPWGEKALSRFLGPDRTRWRREDATALVEDGARFPELLIDQGAADSFLEIQLRPERFVRACAATGQALTMRMQDGYDHSYFFVSTFIEDHLRWHAARLR